MIDADDPLAVQESPRESLLKDSYFVSGRVIGIGSGIAKRFKDPALLFWNKGHIDFCFIFLPIGFFFLINCKVPRTAETMISQTFACQSVGNAFWNLTSLSNDPCINMIFNLGICERIIMCCPRRSISFSLPRVSHAISGKGMILYIHKVIYLWLIIGWYSRW